MVKYRSFQATTVYRVVTHCWDTELNVSYNRLGRLTLSYDHLFQIFTVHHKAVGEKGGWESKTVFEQSVVVLEGFRAHTNYTIRVIHL